MAYYTDLFSPETYEEFTRSDQSITGFRPRQKNAASRIRPGDKLVCYVTKVSRWAGILEVMSEYFEDSTPLFNPEDDPFVIRFRVKPQVWLPMEKAVPIHEECVWKALSFTRDCEKNSPRWTGKMRASLDHQSPRSARRAVRPWLTHGQGESVDNTDRRDRGEYQRKPRVTLHHAQCNHESKGQVGDHVHHQEPHNHKYRRSCRTGQERQQEHPDCTDWMNEDQQETRPEVSAIGKAPDQGREPGDERLNHCQYLNYSPKSAHSPN